jgi:hypothetical protein
LTYAWTFSNWLTHSKSATWIDADMAILRPGDRPIEPLKKTETGPPEPVVHFAYGANMSAARLRKRMPSCKPLGIATLPGYELRFHKRSMDKSGKCNAFASGNNNRVIGVLFSFDPAERAKLVF